MLGADFDLHVFPWEHPKCYNRRGRPPLRNYVVVYTPVLGFFSHTVDHWFVWSREVLHVDRMGSNPSFNPIAIQFIIGLLAPYCDKWCLSYSTVLLQYIIIIIIIRFAQIIITIIIVVVVVDDVLPSWVYVYSYLIYLIFCTFVCVNIYTTRGTWKLGLIKPTRRDINAKILW